MINPHPLADIHVEVSKIKYLILLSGIFFRTALFIRYVDAKHKDFLNKNAWIVECP